MCAKALSEAKRRKESRGDDSPIRYGSAELVLSEILQSPCFLRMPQSEGLAAEIATPSAGNDNWVFVPVIECFDVFAEPLECRQYYEVEVYKDNSSFSLDKVGTP